ncbi:hypothetical protein GCM10027169_36750 [Gordonia jinhuaensis]|uniref:Uncharacterized protein n=1 Tax=Gordonia jinhuaensis TaxID=1517702 RepID=A0A916T317_9ACTN|nr:hypothetical protein GCM10011489_13680 [Gordonia jinhuaensis]
MTAVTGSPDLWADDLGTHRSIGANTEVGGVPDAAGAHDDFDAAITMAEAAACGNVSWWNEARRSAGDPSGAEFRSSQLLAALIVDSAHRNGMTVADVWSQIRRHRCLP